MLNTSDPFSFNFTQILLYSSGNPYALNITASVAEIELYENIDQLAIHGSMTVMDTDAIVSQLDIQGSEFVSINVTIPDSFSEKDATLSKNFRISKILDTSQAGDNVEAYTFQLVDEDTYINSLYHISRAYTGITSEIIKNILIDYFPGKSSEPLMVGSKPIQGKIKYIVPNINPFRALKVLTDRSTGPTGTPFYVYSTLSDRKVRFFDLKELLDIDPLYTRSYTFSATAASLPPKGKEFSDNEMAFHISRLDTRETEDMLALINNGDVGANYEYINTSGGYVDEYHHNATKMLENVWKKSKTQKSLAPVFDPLAAAGGKYLSDHRSVNISSIAASNIFEEGDVSSLNEDNSEIYHRSKSTGKALKHFTRKNAVHIEVPGRNFFPTAPERNVSVSNKINIQVLANRDIKATDPIHLLLDTKKSGDYIILAAKHVFNNVNGKYSCVLKLGKLGNSRGNTSLNRIGYGQGQVDPALARAAGISF